MLPTAGPTLLLYPGILSRKEMLFQGLLCPIFPEAWILDWLTQMLMALGSSEAELRFSGHCSWRLIALGLNYQLPKCLAASVTLSF